MGTKRRIGLNLLTMMLVLAPGELFAQDHQQSGPLSRFEVPISDYGTMSNIATEFSIEGGTMMLFTSMFPGLGTKTSMSSRPKRNWWRKM